jgi:hypothetical protein
MADTPVEIVGNAQKFTVSMRGTIDPQTGLARTFDILPGGGPLELEMSNHQGVALKVPLGQGWTITIREIG